MYRIRYAQHTDALDIIHVHRGSIRDICSKDYTPEQIEAWAGRKFKPELWCQTIDRDYVWVVELNSEVVGFGHLAIMSETTAEVMGLYFLDVLRGKGAGKNLLNIMNEVAISQMVKKIELHATITAKSFYESQGFAQMPGKCSVEMQGVDIPCYPMEKNLL